MNTIIKFTRFVFALALALSALGVSAPAALAAPPVHLEYPLELSGDITDLCSFSIHNEANLRVREIDFFDKSGALTRIYEQVVEQDTFTANGKTLVGLPFTFNIEMFFDSDGNMTGFLAAGVLERVPLPDGKMFVSAGRLDAFAYLLDHPEAVFILTPDKGNPGNLAGFCAALSP